MRHNTSQNHGKAQRAMCFFLALFLLMPLFPALGGSAYADTTTKTYTKDDVDRFCNMVRGVTPGTRIDFPIENSKYTASVLLPRNYKTDGSIVYNVVVYLDGAYSDQNSVFTQKQLVQETLEYINEKNPDRQFIFVSFGDRGFKTEYLETFVKQIRNQTEIPVYGNVWQPASGDEVRNHYLLCGYSMGAQRIAAGLYGENRVQLEKALMARDDFCSWFSSIGWFSGAYYSGVPARTMNYILASCGDNEPNDATWESRMYTSNFVNTVLMYGEESMYVKFQGCGLTHGKYQTYIIPMYEFLTHALQSAPPRSIELSQAPTGYSEKTYDRTSMTAIYGVLDTLPTTAKGTYKTVRFPVANGSEQQSCTIYFPANYKDDGSVVYNVVVYLDGQNSSSETIYHRPYVFETLNYLSSRSAEEVAPFIFCSFGDLSYSDDTATARFNDKVVFDFFTWITSQGEIPVYGDKWKPKSGDSIKSHYALCGYSLGAIQIADDLIHDKRIASHVASIGFFSSYNWKKDVVQSKYKYLVTSYGDEDWYYPSTHQNDSETSSTGFIERMQASTKTIRRVVIQGGYEHCDPATFVAPLLELIPHAFPRGKASNEATQTGIGSWQPLADVDDDSWWYNANCIYSVFSVHFREELGMTKDQSDILISGILGCIQGESGLDPSRLEGMTTERYAFSAEETPFKYSLLSDRNKLDEFYYTYLQRNFGDSGRLKDKATSGFGRCAYSPNPIPGAVITAQGYLAVPNHDGNRSFFLGGVGYFQWTGNGALAYWAFCVENGLNWASPEGALVYMMTPKEYGGDYWRIDGMIHYHVPNSSYILDTPTTPERAAEVLAWNGLGANSSGKQSLAREWYKRIKNQHNTNPTEGELWERKNIYVWDKESQTFSFPNKDFGGMTTDWDWGRRIIEKAKTIRSGGTYTDSVFDHLTDGDYISGVWEETGFIAFAPDTAVVQNSFASEYGWDRAAITAAEWTGVDGDEYQRPHGHQAETFEDQWAAAINELDELGILPKLGDAGGEAIVAVALAEVDAPDSVEQPLGSNNVKYNWWRYNTNYINDFAISDVNKKHPWCANFVAWCANECGFIESGLFNMSENVSGVYAYQVGRNGFEAFPSTGLTQFGGADYSAVPGDLWLFDAEFTHIGIITSVTDSTVTVTQGNTDDRVMSITYDASSLAKYSIATSTIIHVDYTGNTGPGKEIAPGKKNLKAAYLNGNDKIEFRPEAIAEHGRMETVSYTNGSGKTAEARIYLPFGYDSTDTSKAYNVMVLLPGTGGTKYSWFEDKYCGNGTNGQDVLNYMFQNKLTEPFIAVTVDKLGNQSSWQKDAESIENLLLAVDAKYNTYNSQRVDSSLRETGIRSHYGALGVSEGGAHMYKVITRYCLDRFGYVGFISPGEGPECINRDLAQAKNEIQAILQHYPIYGAFASSGTTSLNNETYYQSKANQTKDFFDSLGVPCERWEFNGAGHEFRNNFWYALYNASLMFFPS